MAGADNAKLSGAKLEGGEVGKPVPRREARRLVPPGDPDALSGAIGEALAMTAEQLESMARSAIGHVNLNFSRAQMCAATLQVYDEVLSAAAAT